MINQGLARVVTDPAGTGNVLAALPISIAGKTGTAQVSRGATHAWFVGYFPVDEPRYAICVFLENGGPGHAACVVTKQIIEEMHKQGIL